MELPALPDGTAVQSHTDWLAQSPANQVAFYNHWDHNSESACWIHVTHPGLVPWVPLLGGEASPHDPNVVALDLHVLDAIFARCFVVNDATVAARLLATNVAEMELDGDRAVQAVRSAVGGFAAATPAVPRAGAARPRSSSAPPPSSELSDGDDSAEEHDDDEEDDDDDPSVLCDAGPVVADTALTPGAEVAVPLKLKGREVHYVATRGGRKQNGNYLVRFPDGLTMEARRDSLFKVIPFDEQI
jgi:ribosomal protein L12E/L44/L45/RPP1/RPP2